MIEFGRGGRERECGGSEKFKSAVRVESFAS